MTKALLFAAFLVSLLLATGEARAQCTCAPQYVDITARDEFNLAYAVFVGKVVAIKNAARDRNNRYVETVTFEVIKAWKRDLDAHLTITNEIEGCVNGFEENEEWLVYVYRHQDGTIGTHCCCSRTKSLAKATEDLKTFADDRPVKILPPQDH